MRWITRENIKVDRVACSWLIKRFVDQAAEFHLSDPALQRLGRIVRAADVKGQESIAWVAQPHQVQMAPPGRTASRR